MLEAEKYGKNIIKVEQFVGIIYADIENMHEATENEGVIFHRIKIDICGHCDKECEEGEAYKKYLYLL